MKLSQMIRKAALMDLEDQGVLDEDASGEGLEDEDDDGVVDAAELEPLLMASANADKPKVVKDKNGLLSKADIKFLKSQGWTVKRK